MNINAYTLSTIVSEINAIVKSNDKKIIANQNLHSIYLCMKNRELYNFINAQSVHADGMSLILLARLFGMELKRENRITYVDFLPELLKMAQKHNHKVFILGGTKESNSLGISKLKTQYPTLIIMGHDGYSPHGIVDKINQFHPNILLVGIGMPQQEFWIRDNYSKVNCNVFLPSGAIIDYVSGYYKTPPRWAGRMGVEWLFRLLGNPGYLWKRYLLEPVYILFHFKQLTKMFKVDLK